MTDSSALAVGTVLENNYKIVRELGRGGFARTYLAVNLRRFSENCVLKQFAPEGGGNPAKAIELFEREASVMYKLAHDQIPKFREQFKTRTITGDSLFIVQDYVEGDNYWQVLDRRGRSFSEAEACEFLRQVLPVLEYIHAIGVIHRDISPDNIICRASDKKPVLIDFGAVREAAAKYSKTQQTIVGKIGFAPEEQMRRGQVGADSDLYAMAATTLALLTGKEPETLYNTHLARWEWDRHVTLSPEFNRVLEKMLAYRIKDRYQSAGAVLMDLPAAHQLSHQAGAIGNIGTALFSQLKTMVVAPKGRPSKTKASPAASRKTKAAAELKKPARGVFKWMLISFALAWAGNGSWDWLKQQGMGTNSFDLGKSMSSLWPKDFDLGKSLNSAIPKSWDPMKSVNQAIAGVWPKTDVKGQGTIDEKTIKAKIAAVQKKLKATNQSINKFYKKVDKAFYQKHPELKNRDLQPNEADRQLRFEWWSIAENMVD
jgi:serine/threonine protein kinase